MGDELGAEIGEERLRTAAALIDEVRLAVSTRSSQGSSSKAVRKTHADSGAG